MLGKEYTTMNADELAQHIQKLFSEKLKLNFGLDVFKDALAQLDQVEIEDLSVYVDSLAKFSADDSVIRKMLEAVCSEKECGAQLTDLLQRWNGIFPHNPIPVPAPEVVSTANSGLVAATVVLGILSISLLGLGAGYTMYKRRTGALNLENHFRDNINMIDMGRSRQDLSRNTSPNSDARELLSRHYGAVGVLRTTFPDAGKPLTQDSDTVGVSGNASPGTSNKPLRPGHATPDASRNASPYAGKPLRPGYVTPDVSRSASPDTGKPLSRDAGTADVSRSASPDTGKPLSRDAGTAGVSRSASPDTGKPLSRDAGTSMRDSSQEASSETDKSKATGDLGKAPSSSLNKAGVDQPLLKNRSRI
ncbi:hypothetical protein [Neorickettsia sp. 179522]|uniref:hypothetical protein n=1 Tax=Neorickettsia sp. 179522 TaxID=1714371 RepID=UPI0007987DDE|nr:hypothetical protein [Neorickettsia sp. 179522]KYH12239.1 hypothetical protein AS219_00155 [Neorickettsia sp. 179522]